MLGSALSALSDRLDAKFLTAYWLPAFVAGLLGTLVLATAVGRDTVLDWVADLDSVEQTLATLLIVLSVTMAAFVLRALSRPITACFAGIAIPGFLAGPMRRSQLRQRSGHGHKLVAPAAVKARTSEAYPSAAEVRVWVDQQHPDDPDDTQATRIGNILATATEHPRISYLMDGLLWWPRLAQVVPAAYEDALGSAQAGMMSLLNLAIVFAVAAVGGGLVLGPGAGNWRAALLCAVGGLLVARLCYQAAVSQAQEVGSLLRVGFDLYRHEVLRQMDVEVPDDPEEERVLWERLTREVMGTAFAAKAPRRGPKPADPAPPDPAPDEAPHPAPE